MGGLRSLRRSIARADVEQDRVFSVLPHKDEVKGVAGAIAASQHVPPASMNRRVKRGLANTARRLVLNRKSG